MAIQKAAVIAKGQQPSHYQVGKINVPGKNALKEKDNLEKTKNSEQKLQAHLTIESKRLGFPAYFQFPHDTWTVDIGLSFENLTRE